MSENLKQNSGAAKVPGLHGKKILRAGADAKNARGLVILLHGRGASAEDILGLAEPLGLSDFTLWAPQAEGATWYPYPFISAPSQNEPKLSAALSLLAELVSDAEAAGFPRDKIYFTGFSQGACLSQEFLARNTGRWGGLAAFAGGLIGDRLYTENYPGDLQETPVLLVSSDPDPHIPVPRVEESAATFAKLGAKVELKIYPRIGHTIVPDEIQLARRHVFGTL